MDRRIRFSKEIPFELNFCLLTLAYEFGKSSFWTVTLWHASIKINRQYEKKQFRTLSSDHYHHPDHKLFCVMEKIGIWFSASVFIAFTILKSKSKSMSNHLNNWLLRHKHNFLHTHTHIHHSTFFTWMTQIVWWLKSKRVDDTATSSVLKK